MSLHGTEDIRVAIVVDPALAVGFMANTVGAIAIGLGAAMPGLGGVNLTDHDQFSMMTSADRPVPILRADDAVMNALLTKVQDRPDDAVVVAFPSFARSLHSFADYETVFPDKTLAEEKIDGLGLCGPAKWVKSVTGSLGLLR